MPNSGRDAESNRQVVLARRPSGPVTEDCFEVVERPVPELGPGEALLEVQYVGIDPTIRGWLDERGNYMPGRRHRRAGPIERRRHRRRDQRPGEVSARARRSWRLIGWQQYCVLAVERVPAVTMRRRRRRASLDVLNVLGHIGLTAYLGVHRGGQARNRARRSSFRRRRARVGSIAGQIAKLQRRARHRHRGRRRRSAHGWSTSSASTRASTTSPKTLPARLKELAPQGVDVFFDNVGGELLDTVLRRLADRGRVVLCGDISTYDLDGPPPPLHNVRYLMGKRARMEGFNTLDHWDSLRRGRRPARGLGRRRQASSTASTSRRPRPRARSARPPLHRRPPRQARRQVAQIDLTSRLERALASADRRRSGERMDAERRALARRGRRPRRCRRGRRRSRRRSRGRGRRRRLLACASGSARQNRSKTCAASSSVSPGRGR